MTPPNALEKLVWDTRYPQCKQIASSTDIIFVFPATYASNSKVSGPEAVARMQEGYLFLQSATGADVTKHYGARTVVGIRDPAMDQGKECTPGWDEADYDKHTFTASWVNMPPSYVGKGGEYWGCADEGFQPLELFTHEIAHPFAKLSGFAERVHALQPDHGKTLVEGTCDYVRLAVAVAMGQTDLAVAMHGLILGDTPTTNDYWRYARVVRNIALCMGYCQIGRAHV